MHNRDDKGERVADNIITITTEFYKYCHEMGSKPHRLPTMVQFCSVSVYLLGDKCEIAIHLQLMLKAG